MHIHVLAAYNTTGSMSLAQSKNLESYCSMFSSCLLAVGAPIIVRTYWCYGSCLPRWRGWSRWAWGMRHEIGSCIFSDLLTNMVSQQQSVWWCLVVWGLRTFWCWMFMNVPLSDLQAKMSCPCHSDQVFTYLPGHCKFVEVTCQHLRPVLQYAHSRPKQNKLETEKRNREKILLHDSTT